MTTNSCPFLQSVQEWRDMASRHRICGAILLLRYRGMVKLRSIDVDQNPQYSASNDLFGLSPTRFPDLRKFEFTVHIMPSLLNQPLSHQGSFLLLLGLAVACVSWTITHEEVFREPREYCKDKSQNCKPLYQRKFFYLFTCEYCFSHYVTAFFLLLTHFQMLYQGWRGFVISEFALVWVANVYMGVFNHLRLEIKAEKLSIAEQAPTSA